MAVSHSARYQYAIRAGGAAARPCLPLKSRVVLKLADTARPYLQNIHVVSRAYVLLTLLSVLSHASKKKLDNPPWNMRTCHDSLDTTHSRLSRYIPRS